MDDLFVMGRLIFGGFFLFASDERLQYPIEAAHPGTRQADGRFQIVDRE